MKEEKNVKYLMKKITAFLLTLAMVVSLLPAAAVKAADEGGTEGGGTGGETGEHTHEWSYEGKPDFSVENGYYEEITATCNGSGTCGISSLDLEIVVKLTGSGKENDSIHEGSDYTVEIIGKKDTTNYTSEQLRDELKMSTPALNYQKNSGGNWTEKKPTEPGSYRVKASFNENVVLIKDFTISEHKHVWEYKGKVPAESLEIKEYEKITATCKGSGTCGISSLDLEIVVKLTGSDKENAPIHEGSDYTIKVLGTKGEESQSQSYTWEDLRKKLNMNISEINITYKDTTTILDPNKLPTAPGTYTVKASFKENDGNTVVLIKDFTISEHEHVWEYKGKVPAESSGIKEYEKITATCNGSGTCGSSPLDLEIVVKPKNPDKENNSIHEGSDYTIKVLGTKGEESQSQSYTWEDLRKKLNMNISEINITYKDTTTILDPNKLPTAPGKYTVKASFKGNDGNTVVLIKNFEITHKHNWEYKPSGNQVNVNCTGENCDYNKNGIIFTLKLKVNNKPHTLEFINSSYEVEVSVKDKNGHKISKETLKTLGISYPTIQYKIEGTTTILPNPPSQDGTYYAQLVFRKETGKETKIEKKFIIDKTAPSITGITSGATYYNKCRPVTVSVTDKNFSRLKANANVLASASGNYTLAPGAYVLTAEDKAGNVTSINVNIKDAHANSSGIKNKKAATCTISGYSGDVYCTACTKLVRKGNVLKALGYRWDSGRVTKSPTNSQEGRWTYTCKNGCRHSRSYVLPKKTITVTLGKKAKIISNNSGVQKMYISGASKHKKYLTFNTKTGTISTKKYYKKKLPSTVTGKVKVGGKTYTVKIKPQIAKPSVKVSKRKMGKKGYRYTFKYNLKGATKVKVRLKKGGNKAINRDFDKYISKKKSNKDSYIQFSRKSMKKVKNKMTFVVVAYYGKNKSQTLTITK